MTPFSRNGWTALHSEKREVTGSTPVPTTEKVLLMTVLSGQGRFGLPEVSCPQRAHTKLESLKFSLVTLALVGDLAPKPTISARTPGNLDRP